ncbi:hypothetical protein SeMB42_g06866 [Synchytrium endobioticum]|nr:hypothetical protein SeMB42_g06866 [Synchytrium endobioticum]
MRIIASLHPRSIPLLIPSISKCSRASSSLTAVHRADAPAISLSTLLKHHLISGKRDIAFKLFLKMADTDAIKELDPHHFEALLAKDDETDKVKFILQAMTKAGKMPTVKLLNMLMRDYSEAANVDAAKEIHREIEYLKNRDKSVPPLAGFDHFLACLARANRIDEAIILLRHRKYKHLVSMHSYNAVLLPLARAGLKSDFFRFKSEGEAQGYVPTLSTYSYQQILHWTLKEYDDTIAVLQTTKHAGLNPSQGMQQVAVLAHVELNQFDEAKAIISQWDQKWSGAQENMLYVYSKANEPEKAFETLMQYVGRNPFRVISAYVAKALATLLASGGRNIPLFAEYVTNRPSFLKGEARAYENIRYGYACLGDQEGVNTCLAQVDGSSLKKRDITALIDNCNNVDCQSLVESTRQDGKVKVSILNVIMSRFKGDDKVRAWVNNEVAKWNKNDLVKYKFNWEGDT